MTTTDPTWTTVRISIIAHCYYTTLPYHILELDMLGYTDMLLVPVGQLQPTSKILHFEYWIVCGIDFKHTHLNYEQVWQIN